MSINYPTSLDTFSAVTNDTDVRTTHPAMHNTNSDILAALEAKVGVDSSAVVTSLDYLVAALDSTKFDTSDFASYFDTRLATKDTADLTEGTNLYYTTTRWDTQLATKTTADLTEGANLYYTTARWDTRLAAKSTTNLTEGTNLYYTIARFDSRFDTQLATKSTTNLSEGSNLYYTNARVDTEFDIRLATKDTDDLSEGTSNLYYTEARVTANTTVAGNVFDITGLDTRLGTAESDITALETLDGVKVSKLYQPDNTNPFVYTDNSGALHIDGDITQSGSAYETHAEQLYTTKDFIKTRDGAVAGLSLGEISGMEVLLYDGTNNLTFGTDSDGYFKVGEAGDLQILATREDSPEDGGVAFWDDTNKRFNTGIGLLWDGTDLTTTGIINATTFVGTLTGNADTVTTNANLTGVITSVGNATSIASQTGTGTKFVVDTSPTLVTPILGTPTSGTLTNCIFPTLNQDTTGNSGTVTNGVYTTDNLSVLSATTSAQLLGIISDETGSGVLVFSNSPTLVTPEIGVATGTSLEIANNEWFSALDYAGTGVVNMFKVNEDNEIDVGGTLNIGTLSLTEDSGAVTLVNMPVSSTPTAGDEMSYSFSVDSTVIAKVYAEADGSGGIQNASFNITGDISATGNIHTTIKTITSTTSLSINDANMVVCNSSSDFTVTLPTATTGVTYMIKNINTGTVTIDGYSTLLIDDMSDIDIEQWESVTLVSNGTIWLIN